MGFDDIMNDIDEFEKYINDDRACRGMNEVKEEECINSRQYARILDDICARVDQEMSCKKKMPKKYPAVDFAELILKYGK
jgi:hypothetical protein